MSTDESSENFFAFVTAQEPTSTSSSATFCSDSTEQVPSEMASSDSEVTAFNEIYLKS
jgi:hypothetical protein